MVFHSDIIPVAEHYLANRSIATHTLTLLAKVVDDEEIIGSHVIKFVIKLIPVRVQQLCFSVDVLHLTHRSTSATMN